MCSASSIERRVLSDVERSLDITVSWKLDNSGGGKKIAEEGAISSSLRLHKGNPGQELTYCQERASKPSSPSGERRLEWISHYILHWLGVGSWQWALPRSTGRRQGETRRYTDSRSPVTFAQRAEISISSDHLSGWLSGESETRLQHGGSGVNRNHWKNLGKNDAWDAEWRLDCVWWNSSPRVKQSHNLK